MVVRSVVDGACRLDLKQGFAESALPRGCDRDTQTGRGRRPGRTSPELRASTGGIPKDGVRSRLRARRYEGDIVENGTLSRCYGSFLPR